MIAELARQLNRAVRTAIAFDRLSIGFGGNCAATLLAMRRMPMDFGASALIVSECGCWRICFGGLN